MNRQSFIAPVPIPEKKPAKKRVAKKKVAKKRQTTSRLRGRRTRAQRPILNPILTQERSAPRLTVRQFTRRMSIQEDERYLTCDECRERYGRKSRRHKFDYFEPHTCEGTGVWWRYLHGSIKGTATTSTNPLYFDPLYSREAMYRAGALLGRETSLYMSDGQRSNLRDALIRLGFAGGKIILFRRVNRFFGNLVWALSGFALIAKGVQLLSISAMDYRFYFVGLLVASVFLIGSFLLARGDMVIKRISIVFEKISTVTKSVNDRAVDALNATSTWKEFWKAMCWMTGLGALVAIYFLLK